MSSGGSRLSQNRFRELCAQLATQCMCNNAGDSEGLRARSSRHRGTFHTGGRWGLILFCHWRWLGAQSPHLAADPVTLSPQLSSLLDIPHWRKLGARSPQLTPEWLPREAAEWGNLGILERSTLAGTGGSSSWNMSHWLTLLAIVERSTLANTGVSPSLTVQRWRMLGARHPIV
jgi:hypothetical protein